MVVVAVCMFFFKRHIVYVLSKLKTEVFKEEYLVIIQGPVVQSIVSLTSSLVVKILTVLVRIISNSQVFLLKKCE